MELRDVEAFVAVATELHFGRAAAKLHIGQPTLSDLVRRLERELDTALFVRTTRRVSLTAAGAELLIHSKTILDDVTVARAAVRRIADGTGGTVRLGVTPPAAPVLAPHLVGVFAAQAPGVTVEVERMWLPMLSRSVEDATVDVAITCGLMPEPDGIVGEVFCGEPLLVAVRPTHRLASRSAVHIEDLAHDTLGATRMSLFPAWALAQRQALDAAGIEPPAVELLDADLAASRWTEQEDADWIMTVRSLTAGRRDDVVLPLDPPALVPFTLQWNPNRVQTAAVARFVHAALTADTPPGWRTGPGHLRHD